MALLAIHLAGSTFCEGQNYLQNVYKNRQILRPENSYLVRESNNRYDTNAVQLWYDDNGRQIRLGYVERTMAPEVAHCMDNGGSAYVINLTICRRPEYIHCGLYFEVQTVNPCEIELPDDLPAEYELSHSETLPDYGIDIPELYYGIPEPPYENNDPNIPDDCDWEINDSGNYHDSSFSSRQIPISPSISARRDFPF